MESETKSLKYVHNLSLPIALRKLDLSNVMASQVFQIVVGLG